MAKASILACENENMMLIFFKKYEAVKFPNISLIDVDFECDGECEEIHFKNAEIWFTNNYYFEILFSYLGGRIPYVFHPEEIRNIQEKDLVKPDHVHALCCEAISIFNEHDVNPLIGNKRLFIDAELHKSGDITYDIEEKEDRLNRFLVLRKDLLKAIRKVKNMSSKGYYVVGMVYGRDW